MGETQTAGAIEHSRLVRPCIGEPTSGDGAVACEVDGGLFAAIIDVLGHGREAHSLAVEIEAFLRQGASRDVKAVMQRLHEHLGGSRGAGAGLCHIEASSGRLRYCGVGNTVLRRIGSSEVHLVSRDGVLGSRIRTPAEEALTLAGGDVVLLYTDGVRAHFAPSDYPTLLGDDVSTIASTVVRRFGKDHDDAGCVALRYR